jgi:uncharacterized membrane protein
MMKNNPKTQSRTAKAMFWALSHLKAATLVVALIILVLGGLLLCFAKYFEPHLFTKDVLVNLAAGFFEIGIGTALAVGLTSLVTRSKFEELARPTLRLIQSLRISGRLADHAARNSVVFAVALLSENNVSKRLQRDVGKDNDRCPICTMDVTNESERCFHCHLPKAVWNDAEFVAVDERNESEKALRLARDSKDESTN